MATDRTHSPRRRLSPVAAAGARPLFEAAGLGVPLLLLLFIGTAGYLGSTGYFSRVPSVGPSAESGPVQPSNKHRIGAILFVPWTGVSSCEERRFDNLTGRILSDRTVTCDFPPPDQTANTQLRLSDEIIVDGRARMRAILEAFKK